MTTWCSISRQWHKPDDEILQRINCTDELCQVGLSSFSITCLCISWWNCRCWGTWGRDFRLASSWLGDNAGTTAGCRRAVGPEFKCKWQQYLLTRKVQVATAQSCEWEECQGRSLNGTLLLKRFSATKSLATSDVDYIQVERLSSIQHFRPN